MVKASKSSKPKKSTNYALLLLAIFFACALGLFVLHDNSLSATVPAMNKIIKREFVVSPSNIEIIITEMSHEPDPDLVQLPEEVKQQNKNHNENQEDDMLMRPQTSYHPPVDTSKFATIRQFAADLRLLTLQSLKAHPLHDFPNNGKGISIEDLLVHMHQHPKCRNIPLIITMAKVGSPIYWQLVENFQYTMAKYELAECSLLICLDDQPCLHMCQNASFPCYNYEDQVLTTPIIIMSSDCVDDTYTFVPYA
jgi:hypothetical protein